MEKKKPSKKPAKKKPVKKASVKRKKTPAPPETLGSCSHSMSYTFTNAESYTSDIPGYDPGSEEGDMTGVEIHIVNASVPKIDTVESLKNGVRSLLKRLRAFCVRGGQEEQSI